MRSATSAKSNILPLIFFVPPFLVPFKCWSPSAIKHLNICSAWSDEVFCWVRTLPFYSACLSASILWSLKGTWRDSQWHREDQLILPFISLFGPLMELLLASHFFCFLCHIVLSAFLFLIAPLFFYLPLVFPRAGKHASILNFRKCSVWLFNWVGTWGCLVHDMLLVPSGGCQCMPLSCHSKTGLRILSHLHLSWWDKNKNKRAGLHVCLVQERSWVL